MVRVLMKVTYEKCAGNAPTTHATIPLGRVLSWLARFRRKHVFNVRWELLDEPQPKDMAKLTAAFRALGDW
jgi:hypothetical protein